MPFSTFLTFTKNKSNFENPYTQKTLIKTKMRQLLVLIIILICILYVYGYGTSNWSIRKSIKCLIWNTYVRNKLFHRYLDEEPEVMDWLFENQKKLKILYLHKPYEDLVSIINKTLNVSYGEKETLDK